MTSLRCIVRTPREVVLDVEASSLRVPTETGQVGIRPRMEALVLAIEAGLVLIHLAGGIDLVGTAGGLLRCDGKTASLLTPLAVTGAAGDEVMSALEQALAEPNAEMEARATLGRLQQNILREVRGRSERAGWKVKNGA